MYSYCPTARAIYAVKMTFNNNSIMRGLPMYAQFGTKGLREHGTIRQGRKKGTREGKNAGGHSELTTSINLCSVSGSSRSSLFCRLQHRLDGEEDSGLYV